MKNIFWLVSLFLLISCGGNNVVEPVTDPVDTIVITAVPLDAQPQVTPLIVPTAAAVAPLVVPIRAPDVPMIVVVSEGKLFGLLVDPTDQGFMSGDLFQISEESDIISAKISPDGRYVAYRAGAWMGGENRLTVVSWDGKRTQLELPMAGFPFVAEMTELQMGDATDPNQSVMVTEYQWVNGNQLLFGTGIYNSMGFSPGSHSDLWSVTIDDQRFVQLLPAGSGAPIFTVSAQNGRVLLGRQDGVLSSDLTGSEPTLLFPVQPLLLMESFYYPSMQWVQDGAVAYVTVSLPIAQNGDGPPNSQSAFLVYVPAEGPPGELNPIFNNDIYAPPIWSDDGIMVGYAQSLQDGSNLIISDAALQDPIDWMVQEDYMSFHSWAPDSNHFVYSDGAGYYVDGFDEFYLQRFLGINERTVATDWINESHLLVGVNNYEGGSFIEGVSLMTGENQFIVDIPGNFFDFDLWVP